MRGLPRASAKQPQLRQLGFRYTGRSGRSEQDGDARCKLPKNATRNNCLRFIDFAIAAD
jgi:hypothetical protein